MVQANDRSAWLQPPCDPPFPRGKVSAGAQSRGETAVMHKTWSCHSIHQASQAHASSDEGNSGVSRLLIQHLEILYRGKSQLHR